MRKTLDLKEETEKLILWRRITRSLKDLYNKKANKDVTKDKEFDINNAKDRNIRNKQSHTQGSEVPPFTSRKLVKVRLLQPMQLFIAQNAVKAQIIVKIL